MSWDNITALSKLSFDDMSSENLLNDYFTQSMRHPMEEEEDLIDANYHKWPLEKLYLEFGSAEGGLTSVQAKYNRRKYGINHTPSPINAPAWLCCLLPCLFATPIMEKYAATVPEHAMVLRNGDWLKMDSESLVPGDVVEVKPGERVPADIRIIESDHCTFNPSALYPSNMLKVDVHDSTNSIIGSPNMGLLGFLVVSGSCKGIVVATGKRTALAKLIKANMWNPK